MTVRHVGRRLGRHAVSWLAVAFLVVACQGAPRDRAADTAALEGIFPSLEKASVTDYQDWRTCHSIVTEGLLYTDAVTTDAVPPIKCYLVDMPPHPLAGPALDTFRAIESAFEAAGVPVLDSAISYDSSGRLDNAHFELGCSSPCEFGRYIYERGGHVSDPDSDTGPGVTTMPVTSEWVWYESH